MTSLRDEEELWTPSLRMVLVQDSHQKSEFLFVSCIYSPEL